MADLPSGTVTFLLTDVEGSTALWEEAPEAMRQALARHDGVLTAGIELYGGIVVKNRGEGDSLFAVFARASDAIAATASLQRALYAEAWPTATPLRVRMAVDTGEAELRDGDYFGAPINRCARMRSAAHGGQVLISASTQALVRGHLPEGMTLLDLGEHRFRGLEATERVYQLVGPDLPDAFPPLTSPDTRPNNLPIQPTMLVGRQRDVAAARALLVREDVRLLTLTGPGGTGKTRLGLQLATDLLDDLPDGAFFVPLAPLRDPELVTAVIAQALGVRQAVTRSLLETLQASLRERRLLLLLDNFEHLPSAAPLVADLLSACPGLKVLATSRAPLHVYGEHEFPVPPLALPDLRAPTTPDTVAEAPAVALFVERARATRPDFRLTAENAPSVAELCVRLDGLPLALELAAARIKLLPPRAILARLGSRLDLLVGGAVDRPARQQTLRAAIAWSHDILPADEQQLLRRLAVFSGGWTLEAAETVAGLTGSTPIDVFERLAVLLDQSLVRETEQSNGEPRFSMLETIRDYARERLDASGESTVLRRRHAEYFLALVETAAPKLPTEAGPAWLTRLESEIDNLRALMEWSLTPGGDVEMGVRLAEGLLWFWMVRGLGREGRLHLSALVAQTPGRTLLRGRALHALGWLALHHGDLPSAVALLDEALTLRRELDDRQGIATTLEGLGLAAHGLGDAARAAALLEECLARWQELGGPPMIDLRANLAEVMRDLGDYGRAAALHEENLHEYRQRGHRHGELVSLRGLGHLARLQEQFARADDLLSQSLGLVVELQDARCAPVCLEEVACLASVQGWASRAARLFGAAETLREVGGFALPPEHAEYDRHVGLVRAALDAEQVATTWAAGRAMSLEQAVEYAASPSDREAPVPVHQSTAPGGTSVQRPSARRTGDILTPREREVAGLVARGLTDPQIAEVLVIGRRTAETHVARCLGKLGLATRTQLATWVAQQAHDP